VEIEASHCGMAVNVAAFRAVLGALTPAARADEPPAFPLAA
jgi:hypothetical protein